eukprot:6121704-Pleurochrysis_carterae.AAC.1
MQRGRASLASKTSPIAASSFSSAATSAAAKRRCRPDSTAFRCHRLWPCAASDSHGANVNPRSGGISQNSCSMPQPALCFLFREHAEAARLACRVSAKAQSLMRARGARAAWR